MMHRRRGGNPDANKLVITTAVPVPADYSNPVGAELFDPTFATAADTYIDWVADDGQSGTMVRTGSAGAYSHAHSKNGFASVFFQTPGPHRVAYRVRGGLGLVTGIDGESDANTAFKNFAKLINCTNQSIGNNAACVFNLSDVSRKCTHLELYSNAPTVGDTTSLRTVTLAYVRIPNCPSITGTISDFGPTVTYLSIAGTAIRSGSAAGLVAIATALMSSMGWLTADVDLVLKSISDALHTNVNHFTYATPTLSIGGTNQAPSHLDGWIDPLITPGTGNSDAHWEWDAVLSKHKAISGGAAIWAANHCVGHPWTITYNGGISEDIIFGNTTTAGWNIYYGNANHMNFEPYTSANNGTIGDLRIRCNSVPGAKIRAALYADNAGVPGTLLAYSSELVSPTLGINTFQLNVQVPVTSGAKYWIAAISDTTGVIQRADTAGAGYRLDSYGYVTVPSWPEPPGLLTATAWRYDFAGWGLKVV
jgi:hypothetical protein